MYSKQLGQCLVPSGSWMDVIVIVHIFYNNSHWLYLQKPTGLGKCYTHFLVMVLEMGRAEVNSPNFQMGKLRPREVSFLIQGSHDQRVAQAGRTTLPNSQLSVLSNLKTQTQE